MCTSSPQCGQVLGESGDARRVDAPGGPVQVPPQLQGVALDDFEEAALDGVVETLPGGDARIVEVVGAGQRTQFALTPVEVGQRDGGPAGPPVLGGPGPQRRCFGRDFGVRESRADVLPGGVRRQSAGPVEAVALGGQFGGGGPAGLLGVAGRGRRLPQ